MNPSSADTGFFQPLPQLQNQFHDDVSFQRVFQFFVPDELRKHFFPELAQLGADVLDPRVFDWITDAERNLPYLKGNGCNALGHPTSELVTGEGWRRLQAFGIERGLVAFNYTTDHGPYSRLLQMMRFHLWEASSASTTCPGAMTDGAARLLQRHLASPDLQPTQRRVFQRAYDRLTSRDPAQAWTSGQWMTERPGGSDVSRTETTARYVGDAFLSAPSSTSDDGLPLGPWEINGFKWFSSATDAGMAILLARTHPSRGLSAFYAPMRRRRGSGSCPDSTELNGIRILRLKDKLGTRPVPTAELELRGLRAWLIGQEGHGVREIATVLAITRVHCSVACLGQAGRALGVAKAYALVREISAPAPAPADHPRPNASPPRHHTIPLARSPLHMRTLAELTAEYHGLMLLTMYTAFVMGLEERAEATTRPENMSPALPLLLAPPPRLVAPLLRTLSSLHKAYCCKQAVPLLHGLCLEALGGVGYLLNSESEPMNLARLFRDGCVNAIWEGTTDVLSTDLIRTLTSSHGRGRASLDALDWMVRASHSDSDASDTTDAPLLSRWTELRARIESAPPESLLPNARVVLFSLAEILIAGLLHADARRHPSPAAEAMYRRFLVKKGFLPLTAALSDNRLDVDVAIVYGENPPSQCRFPPTARL